MEEETENKLWDILVDLKEDKICIEGAIKKIKQLYTDK